MSSKLDKLKKESKKLEEASGALGKGTGEPNKAAAKKGAPYEHSAGTRDNPGLSSTDDHSKAVPPEHERDQGVHASGTPQAYEPKAAEMGGAGKTSVGATVKKVAREEGASAGKKEVGEYEGTDKEVDGANTVDREEGSAAGKKEVGEYGDFDSFRAKVRGAFGLPLNDKLNKGNDGL